MNSSDNIMIELIKNQIKTVSGDKKLSYNDLKRISKYLSNSIFTDNTCAMWTGYHTIIKNEEKNSYINFYFNGKKHALHRLLYLNYIGELADSEYIKFKCIHKGKCCNINHFYKINKDSNSNSPAVTSPQLQPIKESIIKKNIIVDFNL